MQGVTLTVSQLNEYVRRSLASDPMLQGITLRGEISNFKTYASGHWYFSLKDEKSRIDCALFRQYTYGVRFVPRDGMQVLVTGTAGLYVQGGKYQFYADGMMQDGMGELYERFLQLKDKLAGEGLFDASRKRPLPLLPRKVGIVTSASGAVLHDIRTVAGRRFPGIRLVLRPSLVQGEGAAKDLAEGLRTVSRVPGVDVVIIGRGGGSMEDLWAFNEEILVRAVASCCVPVVSAVGHETDTTLCDYAADMRAPTPSAAAELAVPRMEDLEQAVADLEERSRRAVQTKILVCRGRLQQLETRLAALQPVHHVRQMLQQTVQMRLRLREAAGKYTALLSQRVSAAAEKLYSVGPRQVLERGYAIALKDGKPVTELNGVRDDMELLFRDGSAWVHVLSRKEGDPFDTEERHI
ncbi:MAG: exodeoxyribonuclease VII large subunit [Clostridia bacterium]|nr:exodeoxyribonuclease VII large subunit [Clostridia bacterium]